MEPINFSKKLNVIHGDCLDVMRTMPEACVDLVVCDPPYGYGFMQLEFDKDVPTVDIWKECLRVMKPGAFAFVMSAPRADVQAKMIYTLREAGFWIDFTPIYWAYACLSEDTEVLTPNGWELYHTSNTFKNTPILIYDYENHTYRWEVPHRWNAYQIKDTCYRIKSNFTDQLITRNHRVAIEQEGKILFKFAEEIGQEVSVPYLESVPMLSKDFYDIPCLAEKEKNRRNVLLNKLSAKSEHQKISFSEWETYPQVDRQTKTRATFGNDWGKKLGMEGGGDLFQDTWELCGSKVCKMSTEIYEHGAKGWICDGASPDCCESNEQEFIENRSGASHRSQPMQQFLNESGFICNQQGTQTARTWKTYKTTLAKVSCEYYSGLVFCPTVSTGCFIARRNGKIFLTGNSGFPKAMNISKAIDKRNGAEREIIGTRTSGIGQALGDGEWQSKTVEVPITVPASEDAKKFDGSFGGFQPKPAVEVILVAMKPCAEKSFIDQALANGKGVTWLGNCRIPYANKDDRMGAIFDTSCGFNQFTQIGEEHKEEDVLDTNYLASEDSRFPANLLVSGKVLDSNEPCIDKFSRYFNLDAWWDQQLKFLPKEQRVTFPFLIEPKPSKAEKNEGCENLEAKPSPNSLSHGTNERLDGKPVGTNNNNHPTVKPIDLMAYLVVLGSQRNELVMDPFLGSGTTCIASDLMGRNSIGIEREAEYFEIARTRCKPYAEQTRLM